MAGLINVKVFKAFLKSGAAGGVLLLTCVTLSLTIANTPLGVSFSTTLSREIGFNTSGIVLRYSLLSWINDGLMAVFFLMVGLEIKREVVKGELSSFKQASLPIFAAAGGAILPAAIYFFLNKNTATAAGWGIPMATDIAFAIAIISMLGTRVPPTLKIFLAALAIVDDLIAILIIAIFYSGGLHYNYLALAGAAFAIQLLLNKLNVKYIWAYLLPGALMWYFIHHSGIHATISGVLTALTIPTNTGKDELPLEKLEHALMKPVNYIIMPLFALANTNIVLEAGMLHGLHSPMGYGIMLGLIIGKPLGILLTCWLTVKLGISSLPQHSGWWHIAGVGLLGGIGFTMSVFIALLSFNGQQAVLSEAKFAILAGSALSGMMGFIWLKKTSQ